MKLKFLFFIFFAINLIASDAVVRGSINDGKITPKTIEAEFVKVGFEVADNRDMVDPYMRQFQQSDYEVYNLFTIFDPKLTKELIKKEPLAGLLVPMSMGIYQKKGDKKIYAGILNHQKLEEIANLSPKTLESIEKRAKEALSKAMPNGEYVKFDYKATKTKKEETLKKFSFDVAKGEDIEGLKNDLEFAIEEGLKPNGFVLANFTNYNTMLQKEGVDIFDFYDTYSICKLKVIYEASKLKPEAGVFAPCTLVIYKLKSENKIHIAYPSVKNWINSLNITDKKKRLKS